MQSAKFSLNKADLVAEGKKALIFAGPALLVLLASTQAIIPPQASYGVIVLFVLNRATSMLTAYLKDNSSK